MWLKNNPILLWTNHSSFGRTSYKHFTNKLFLMFPQLSKKSPEIEIAAPLIRR